VKLYILAFILVFISMKTNAQLVQVQYNYNNIGDCIFGAQNQAKTPLFLYLWFTNLERTSFRETTPYVKMLNPGFNALFTLQREDEAGAPYFIFDVKTYRSNPLAEVNLDFPYLIPFSPGNTVTPFEVKSIERFWGSEEPKGWRATGFSATPGDAVFASRMGQIVEITGQNRGGDSKFWYNTWSNAITLLQPDGTLITYKNVIDEGNKLKLNETIYPGQQLGVVSPQANDVVLMIYYNTLISDELQFIIPQFVISVGKYEIITGTRPIEVVRPDEVVGLEMTKKELKRYLSNKNGK